jgi:hypothetical protein
MLSVVDPRQGGAPVCVLYSTKSAPCTKTYEKIGDRVEKSDYPGLYQFAAQEIIAHDINDLATIVETMSKVQNCIIVRAGLTDFARSELTAGRTITRSKNDTAPYLAEIDLPWGMADIDDFRLQSGDDLNANPLAVIERAVEQVLPPAFHGVTTFWQLSASAGFAVGVLKVHLWYWLSQPVANVTMRRRLIPYVDVSPFSAVQPHYICAPHCINLTDPIKTRMGWLAGEIDEVDITAVPMPIVDYLIPSMGGISTGDAVADLMAIIGTMGDGANRFHQPLRDTCNAYSRAVVGRLMVRHDVDFKTFLRSRIDAAPRSPVRDLRRYLSDLYLDDLIRSAMTKRAKEHANSPYQRMLRKLTP